jgi:hypothetical protein
MEKKTYRGARDADASRAVECYGGDGGARPYAKSRKVKYKH